MLIFGILYILISGDPMIPQIVTTITQMICEEITKSLLEAAFDFFVEYYWPYYYDKTCNSLASLWNFYFTTNVVPEVVIEVAKSSYNPVIPEVVNEVVNEVAKSSYNPMYPNDYYSAINDATPSPEQTPEQYKAMTILE